MATALEVMTIRNIRRDMAKLPLEVNRVEISLMKGIVHFTGTVSALKDEAFISVKTEMQDFAFKVGKMPGIKQVVLGCKYVENKPKVHEPHPAAPGTDSGTH